MPHLALAALAAFSLLTGLFACSVTPPDLVGAGQETGASGAGTGPAATSPGESGEICHGTGAGYHCH